MKNTLLATLMTFCLIHQTYSQQTHKPHVNYFVSTWGEVSDYSPEHRGKEGLVLLKLSEDMSFSAFENTDYGAYILQLGTWTLKEKSITFTVMRTILARDDERYSMKGRILALDKGEITYDIVARAENTFTLKDRKSDHTLVFRKTRLDYMPDESTLKPLSTQPDTPDH